MTRRATTEQQDASREQRAESLAEHVRALVDAAPPLSPKQRERLAAVLRRPTRHTQDQGRVWKGPTV